MSRTKSTGKKCQKEGAGAEKVRLKKNVTRVIGQRTPSMEKANKKVQKAENAELQTDLEFFKK